MRIVFMGTPEFAVGALKALREAGHEITAVVTQPDKAKGRSGQLQFTPVKEYAAAFGIPVLQPVRIKTPEAVEELRRFAADVYIVAAFGQLLSQEILDIPRYGCLNIHASLLPKYRGASPIQHAIIKGERKSGVTIMQMDAGLDTGDILYKKETEITDTDNFETLHDRLMALGGEAIVEALPLIEQGKLTPIKQQEEASCYAPLLQKAMGKIDFTRDAFEIDRQIRGMTPWPSAYAAYRGKQLKLWQARPVKETVDGLQPGSIMCVTKDTIQVACGKNALCIDELQLEGKKRMKTHDFLLGVKMQPGERLE
ncbi:MAG: methionyl-tRNA formyltransferase [Roseburia sp.]|nr:methionyl-tRNA formyltransferase [Roseburia sp.]